MNKFTGGGGKVVYSILLYLPKKLYTPPLHHPSKRIHDFPVVVYICNSPNLARFEEGQGNHGPMHALDVAADVLVAAFAVGPLVACTQS